MKSRPRLPYTALILCLILPPVAAHAQIPEPVRLRPASALLAEEFSGIIAVRELADGRVLVADRIEVRLVVADFTSGTVRQIGRRGRGPGEYPGLRFLMPLGGDSTLLVDASSRRWLLLEGERIVATIPPDHPGFRATNGSILGADRLGYVLTEKAAPLDSMNPATTTMDSALVLRVALASGRMDTVARRAPAPDLIQIGGEPGQRSLAFYFTQYGVAEKTLLFPDGWLAIARLDPYRVDWRAPSGQWVRGGALPFRVIRVDDREKEAYAARYLAATGRDFILRPEVRWAATLPPFEDRIFQHTPLLALPDGRLLIARTPTHEQPGNHYDVVDRQGHLVMQLALTASERIVGSGPRGVYLAVTDDDGLERLRRHPLP